MEVDLEKRHLSINCSRVFSKQEICLISQDNYYLPIDQQHVDEQGVTNFDLPNGFDHEAFLRDLHKLIEGETVVFQEYVFNNHNLNPKLIIISPAPIIIVEGIFLFYQEAIRSLVDLKLFIEAKDELKIIRRIRRDGIERNYTMEDVLYRYEHHVGPAYEKYIAPLIEQMDLIILNNSSFDKALEVVSGFIRHKLKSS